MMKKYVCEDGTIYVKSDDYYVNVEEFIEFLQQFKGKKFYNGAIDDLGFRINEEHVWCDEMDYILGTIENEELFDEIYEVLEA